MSFQKISKETICDILFFLSHSDLRAITDTCKYFQKNDLVNDIWMKHCLAKWGIEENDIKGFMIDSIDLGWFVLENPEVN